ncbi:MAG: glycogen/starch/alpha-glucan phosphorylase [Chlamydiales bacterium]|nr:glycogen/starch/alpha-glucan phosphorylase [Chlamydiales bacterium]
MDPSPEFIELQAGNLVAKIKHYLITTMGRVEEEASCEELYRAVSYALREEIMMQWTATTHTYTEKDVKMLYYLSMEYLPGRLLSNNITNMKANPLINRVMKKLNRTLSGLMECESDPSLGNGGLGRLASCFLDSLATQHYPAQAYGLRYQYGIFEQELWEGMQIERPDCWLLYENPWEFRQDLHARNVRFSGRTNTQRRTDTECASLEHYDYDEVRALPYDLPIMGYSESDLFSVVTLRLWSTKESPRNFRLQKYNAGEIDQAAENTTLTDVLYPNDNHEMGKRVRLKQEYLLVSASLQDIIHQYLAIHKDFTGFMDKVRIQINDTHPSLVIAEMMWLLTKEYGLSWDNAWQTTQACTSYTNHTVLKEGLEEWNENRLRTLLPCQYHMIELLNQKFCNQVRARFPGDEERVRRLSIIESGNVRMANLAIVGSHCVNGVAKLHSKILKENLFKEFCELYPGKFINVTNGVTQRRWLLNCNPLLAEFIIKRIGRGWIVNFPELQKLAAFANDPESQQEFLAIKHKNKQAFSEFVHLHNRLRDINGHFLKYSVKLDPNSLFDVHIKRIHEYKRQLMNILHVIMVYQELQENPSARIIPRTVIIGGKAAAGYLIAKQIVQLIYAVSRKVNQDPLVNGALKVVFFENYNVSRAEMLIPAADLSEQISTAGMEASGTGNMKLSINGALTIGTNDGANIEMREEIKDQWWPFAFGASSEEIALMQAVRSYNPWEVCAANPKIKKAVESLHDRTFAQFDIEHQAFTELYYHLLESQHGKPADSYFVLKDLESYAETQKRVEALFLNKASWAEYAIHNIAGMGKFSSDESIKQYAEKIWQLAPCPPDEKILAKVREEYSEHDKCRIL